MLRTIGCLVAVCSFVPAASAQVVPPPPPAVDLSVPSSPLPPASQFAPPPVSVPMSPSAQQPYPAIQQPATPAPESLAPAEPFPAAIPPAPLMPDHASPYGFGVQPPMGWMSPPVGGLHVRHPYYSYRRPWFTPGPASLNVTIIW